jgi:hypothetical protein
VTQHWVCEQFQAKPPENVKMSKTVMKKKKGIHLLSAGRGPE